MSNPLQPPGWLADAVFYQIFVDRFCNGDPSNDPPQVRPWGDLPNRENFFGGDLMGIFKRLDYLEDLGVNALYLNPIFTAQTNHKYDTWDYFSVDPAFGDHDQLKSLVKECHRREMRVILDGVFNHCGLGFFAFQDLARNGPASPYAGWFKVFSYPIRSGELTYMACGNAHYLPKLNLRYRPVQEYILKVARYWLEEADIDGWRLDVPFKVPFEFWREFRQVVKSIKPQAYLLGEVWREAAPWVQGDMFDGTTNYRLRELVLDYVGGETLDAEDFAFETLLLRQSHGLACCAMLNLLGSHDTPRILTLLQGDLARLKIALTFLFTIPGAPLIYYGDEVGMSGGNDPDCRRPMVWERAGQNSQVFDWVQKLVALRKQHPALRYGESETLLTFDGVYLYRQRYKEDEVLVFLNPRRAVSGMKVQVTGNCRSWRDAETGETWPVEKGCLHLPYLPALSAKLFLPAV